MRILNFGSANIDYVYSLDHIVRVGETETTHKMETFPGGKGLNQSIAVSRAGANVFHAGCLGYDGGMLRDILCESGVDVTYLKTVEEKNGHAIIQVSAKGENSIFLYPGSNETVTESYIDDVLAQFGEGDILLLQNEISNVPYIVEKAYEKHMCIILNPSPWNEKARKIDFGMLSYIIVNEVEAQEISGYQIPEEALAFFKERYPDLKVILTLGDKGSIYLDREHTIRQSAFITDVVDTTAAGDTFTGYFVAGVASGVDCADALRDASAAAAISVSRNGAAPSIPWKREVAKSLASLKEAPKNDRRELIGKQIERYLAEHYKVATLRELSGLLNFSVPYTGALVKALMGESFVALLQKKRCAVAAELLLQSEASISEIAHSVGYENLSFFRRKFKETYGKNPLEYRKNRG
jgi:ribokinase